MSTTSSTSSSLALSGLASGIDWTSIVNELLTVEKAPETQMQANQTANTAKITAYQSIGTALTALNTDVTKLSNPSFFDSRTSSVSTPGTATATAAAGAPLGSFNLYVKQVATDAVQLGTVSSGKSLSPTNDVSTLQMSAAGFGTPVTGGTFTVNGQTVTIAATDTLQSVFDKINTATSGAVTGSYDASTDEISLNSSGTIMLGSATDTSNFLQATELYPNSSGTITSASALGGINLSAAMTNANFASTVTDGGAGAGAFTINGVTINYDSSEDSVGDVLQRINDSTAGVTATYDSVNDRFELTDKTTGDVGISMQDVTGNFLAATGLSGGTLQRGTNLQYSINGSGLLTSQSNSVSGAASGITGLTITALAAGTTTISVNADTATISATISQFVTDYNAAQSSISTQTALTTSSTGTATPGTLTGDMDAEGISGSLRQLAGNSPGLSSVIQSLNDLGIISNGINNTLSLTDTTTLNAALATNLSAVKQLFSDPTQGIATKLGAYLTNVTGTKGLLANDENSLTKQNTDIGTSITALNQRLANDQTRLTAEFVAMETAINTINAQKQYLNSYFNSSAASSQSAPVAAGSGSSSSG